MPDRGRIKKNLLALFNKWAAPQLQNYAEPERVGVPRGEPVGFSAKKFHAALGQVLKPAFTLAEIADIVGVSSGQVRVWRTEAPFKKLADKLEEEFLSYISDQLDQDAKLNDMANYTDIFICLAMFHNGILIYYKKLIDTLTNLGNVINKNQNDYKLYVDMKELMSQFMLFFKLLFAKEQIKNKKDEVMLKFFPLIDSMLDYFISILANPEVDENIKGETSAIVKIIALFCFV
jgi:hypothetical protein